MTRSTFENLYSPLKFIFNKRYYKDLYQTLLESITDYLEEGKGIWWRESENGVDFSYKNEIQNTKELHHYCSSTLKDEECYIKNSWINSLKNKNKPIPA